MAFMHTMQPITRATTPRVMLSVVMASLPGLAGLVWFFGCGYLVHAVVCCLLCVAFEAGALRLRQRPIAPALQDGSALVTGWLLALALPPECPGWLLVLACGFAILVVKQLYGGLGFNLFNPAMAAYALLLVCFPREMNHWPSPRDLLTPEQNPTNIWQSLTHLWSNTRVDALATATPLDLVKHNQGYTLQDLYGLQPQLRLGRWAGSGWEWVNLGFLIGGIWLLQQRLIRWHAPVGMVFSLALLAALGYDNGSSNSTGSPIFHLLSGATMLGAFFIVTDPVTCPTSPLGRFVFGAGVGTLVFCIRVWGDYPEGLAFAVLMMNLTAPSLDRLTAPRIFGQRPRPPSARADES